jgi:hypothetical protein
MLVFVFFDPDQGTGRRVVLSSTQQPKEPVMDALQIPFVALFTGMVLSFAAVMIIETVLQARQG